MYYMNPNLEIDPAYSYQDPKKLFYILNIIQFLPKKLLFYELQPITLISYILFQYLLSFFFSYFNPNVTIFGLKF